MSKFSFIPPYLREKLDIIQAFGFKKFILSFIVAVLECTLIFLVINALMSIFIHYPVLGSIILSIIVVVFMAGSGLIKWKKKKRKYDNKEKNI